MSENNDIITQIAEIRNLLHQKKSRVHMLGVCGVGMAGLAFLLKKKGREVTGCDQAPNHLAKWLKKRGLSVFPGHDPSHITSADWIIRSSAVAENNPELQAARKAGKKIFRRGLVLAAISSTTDSICISGTHGKTTTTAMIAQVLNKAGLKPSFCIGGEVLALGGVAGRGTGKNIVLEADESDGTLAFYKPSIAVITNIEFDHAEHFKNLASLKKCFTQLIKGTRRKVVYCFDNKEARRIIGKFQNAVSYGFSAGADLRLINYRENSDGLSFSLKIQVGRDSLVPPSFRPDWQSGPTFLKFLNLNITLPVPGKHNALNAAAACAVGLELGIPFADIARALAEFQPVARRFERIVETKDLLVISDYAHHPTEVAALLSSTRPLKRNRWLAVFQPHRYSRTNALGKLFPPAFRGVDELILCPVYEASEKIVPGGTAWDLYEQFRQYGRIRTFSARSMRQAWDYLKTRATPGDGILIIGAGDVARIGEWARKELKRRGKDVGALPFSESMVYGRARASGPAAFLQSLGVKLKNSSIRINEPMAPKTTLRVGGSADIYIETGDLTDLALIVKWAAKNCIPVRIIGAGSNVLVSDLGVRGIVMRPKGTAWQNIRRENNKEIVVGAGVSLQRLTCWTAQHGMTGAEFLTGIPGTIGGAIRMNAGAWGREIGGIVSWVRIMEQNGKVKRMNQAQLGFSYRSCNGLKNRIVLEAALNLRRGKTDTIRGQMKKNQERRKWMRGLRSAGSVFKNPAGNSAGRLIESLGLKGRRIGRAKISKQHANIIITENGAYASDGLALIEIVRYLVKMKYGVDLKREVEYLE